MKRRLLHMALLLMFAMTGEVFAGVGTKGGVFLEDAIGTRAYGMGGAFLAISDDANSILSNPAGVHSASSPEITTLYKRGIMDTGWSYIGYLQPIKSIGTFTVSNLSFDAGSVDINYLDGTTETVKAEQNSVITLGYGTNLGKNMFTSAREGESIFLGANAKIITSSLAERYSATAIAMDLGMLYRTIDSKFSFGLAVFNLGTALKYISVGDVLPLNVKAGIGCKFFDNDMHSLLVAADVVFSDALRENIGAEYLLFKTLAFRIGTRLGYNPNATTMGVGLYVFGGTFDYAYAPLLDETTHRFSLSFKFGAQDKISIAERYEEKEMYERAQYTRDPDNYKSWSTKTDKERENLKPIITSIEPNKAKPGTEVNVYGIRLGDNKSNIAVRFSGTKADIIDFTERRIRVKVPNMGEGNTKVTVTTNKGVSEPRDFFVLPLKGER